MDKFDAAQVCLNGHLINTAYHSRPDYNKKFCDRCGEKTIINCEGCQSEIKGDVTTSYGVLAATNFTPPDYCSNCGIAFPWLSKKIEAAVELAKLEEVLTEEEEKQFTQYAKDITNDTPGSQVSAKKINILLRKFGSKSLPAIRSLLVDIASESVKKIILDKG